ncbi:hypothetical protein F444_02770 [Phytophthora nicotianae P1976]|uniref:Uncharacterized protein n=1 Tax=Phytophthora nicotianae P1976 TaxID=1317066 RepID=A0A081AW92_PHYNI|nr:hypothetical protein F444_02770 [Phytophthora nicotianae P1976]
MELSLTLPGVLTVRVIERSAAPRNGKQRVITFIPDEGIAVFKTKVLQCLNTDDTWRYAKITENRAILPPMSP